MARRRSEYSCHPSSRPPRSGKIKAIRVLTVAPRSAGDEWISIINQMRHLVFTAPDKIRARFLDLSPIKLARTCAAPKPRRSSDDIVRFTTLSTLRELGRRALFVREQKERLSTELRPLINEFPPTLVPFGEILRVLPQRIAASQVGTSSSARSASRILVYVFAHGQRVGSRSVGCPARLTTRSMSRAALAQR